MYLLYHMGSNKLGLQNIDSSLPRTKNPLKTRPIRWLHSLAMSMIIYASTVRGNLASSQSKPSGLLLAGEIMRVCLHLPQEQANSKINENAISLETGGKQKSKMREKTKQKPEIEFPITQKLLEIRIWIIGSTLPAPRHFRS